MEIELSLKVPVLFFFRQGNMGVKYILKDGGKGTIASGQPFWISNPKCTLEVPFENSSITLFKISPELFKSVYKECPDLKGPDQFAEFLKVTHLYQKHLWLDQILNRYLFELVTKEFAIKSARNFLEIEIIKELYFAFLKDEKDHRHSTIPGLFEIEKFPLPCQKAIKLIEAEPGRDWRLSEISRMVNVSESTLKRYFKSYLKESVGSIIRRVRMGHARKLLSETDLSVAEVADLLSYSSSSAFIKGFKDFWDKSPGTISKSKNT